MLHSSQNDHSYVRGSHLPIHLRPLITFLYFCGVRLGEALQIEWSQVDLKRAVIRIEDEQAKTGEARTVPLPDDLIKMLKQVEEKTGTVFDGTNLRKAWNKACDAAGLGKLVSVRFPVENVGRKSKGVSRTNDPSRGSKRGDTLCVFRLMGE